MAVTISNKPIGHKLSLTPIDAEINDFAGFAYVTMDTTVIDGQYVYIESNIESYNGFKLVGNVSGNSFKIYDRLTGFSIPSVQSVYATVYISELDHGWQSVQLPIVYEMESDLYPVDLADLALGREVGAFSNDNGYTRIATSLASLINWETLNYIQLVGDGPLAGIYQIVTGFDSAHVNIDLAYDASYDFSPYNIVEYKSNYAINVNIISGLMSGHRWDDRKPSRTISTIKITPDSNGRVKFSIAEILKGDMKLRNNTLLDTLPNNLDFYTQFYISYFESYDEVVDGEIVVHEGDTTTDSFIGHAVNSMMPFKSLYQSFMSDYIYTSELSARWLTLQDVPIAVVGYYFDLSFLLQETGDVSLTINKQLNGVVIETELVPISNPGPGVIRAPIEIESGFDKYCVRVNTGDTDDSPAMTSFGNTGSGTSWTLGSSPSVVIDPSTSSKILYVTYPFLQSKEYIITAYYDHNTTGFAFTSQTRVGVYTSANVLLGSHTEISPSGTGSATNVLNYTALTVSDRIGITAFRGPTIGTFTVTITSVTIQAVGSDIIEEICINIITDACENTMIQDNLRLTEDGIFRELE